MWDSSFSWDRSVRESIRKRKRHYLGVYGVCDEKSECERVYLQNEQLDSGTGNRHFENQLPLDNFRLQTPKSGEIFYQNQNFKHFKNLSTLENLDSVQNCLSRLSILFLSLFGHRWGNRGHARL